MDIEICAIKIHTPSCAIVIVTVYRSPTGDVTYFLNTLETAIDQLYNNTTNIILCGDFNIDYLSDNKKKQKLNSLLTSYSLYSIIGSLQELTTLPAPQLTMFSLIHLNMEIIK
jgi:exonuclease III